MSTIVIIITITVTLLKSTHLLTYCYLMFDNFTEMDFCTPRVRVCRQAIHTGIYILVIIVKYFFGALDIFGDVSYNALQ